MNKTYEKSEKIYQKFEKYERNNIKVFDDFYKLSLKVFTITKNYPKQYRPTLGRMLEESLLKALIAIKKMQMSRANTSQSLSLKLKHLNTGSELLDEIKLLIQFSCDLKIISSSTLGDLAELYTEIGKEIGGLIKFEYSKNNLNNKQVV